MAGPTTSAAVDDRGRLFTWGCDLVDDRPAGLGYEHNPATGIQLTPKIVDALLLHRVVGVALGDGFTLVVTDAGAIFSFGDGEGGALGHGSEEVEVLPRRIEVLAETGRRFVAVAAGYLHALALTEEGHVYGWGDGIANGHGQGQRTPQLVTALAGKRVTLVYADRYSSCAVTIKGELHTWGGSGPIKCFHLGHGVATQQLTPKWVEALRHLKVVDVAICGIHMLVASADGAVWIFGGPGGRVRQPTPIPNLRVRTLP